MKIRPFDISDLGQVAVLLDEYRMFYKKDSDVKACKHFIEARYNHNESIIFVAEENDIVFGFVQLYPVFSTVSLQRAYILNDLFVQSNHRSSGAGKKLIEKSFEYAKENNARYVCLETGVDNVKAQGLYEKMGMSVDNEVLYYSSVF
ncbi:GNAT family N-acetyltransferase [Macrococcoides goetzii]|uniref:GNAT family N-acetyltransferase n=1 Tax=Macrococcoides goetzii TaxID=1891097 RepID=A0A2G5NT72_9STAP|nr:GNAT family N-acetyltransferase [Macrococcus goetzii]RAI82927.1 GNAT family N-acetyltransferase [Macrococcus goetzii]